MRRVGRLLAAAVALPFVVGIAAAGATSAPRATVELTFADPAIVESSGLVARDGLVVTVNDSGDTGRVFTVDRGTGETVGVTTWADDPEDVEAVAPAGPGEVWVADTGDNGEKRASVSVTRVPVGRGDRDVRGEVTSYELVYPDGPHDAETLVVEPRTGRLAIVTKGVFGGIVMLAPARLDADAPNRLQPIGNARAIATDGAFWPDGRHVVVRGYSSAAVYTWPGLELVDRFDLPDQMQGEGITVDEDGVVLISSEGAQSEVLRVRLPRRVARAVAPLPPPSPTSSAVPGDPSSTLPAAEPTPDPDISGDPDELVGGRSAWPYAVGLGFGVVMLGLLVRSLRPRG
ncbi:hypothetical protein [Nocardioides sp.]|uniref:hypothetical protein n=1 Tax=Nocardioides sp. TaxID=35761 RepID=UPI002723FAF8|nr:hypothetical protein [Nocardioides sp.]MDO9456308.1 hypothetical protein [Nocardioides sp.]